MNNEIRIKGMDYDNLFKSNSDKIIARVIAEHKEAYKVKNANNEYFAKITGKRIYNAEKREDYPAVGDWVTITILDDEMAIINEILPRKTILKKKYSNKQDAQIIATNINVAFIVESIGRDYNLNRLERYIILANEGNIQPAIILNKVDLISEEELDEKINEIRNRFNDIDIIPTSTTTEQGLQLLMDYIKKGKTYCFIGSSGVGKSSLINSLLGKNNIRTEQISDYADRGKHTTTSREMYFLKNGGIVIDNPGTREVGMVNNNEGIENVFDEIAQLEKKCRFNNCTHTKEKGCAVLNAITEKTLDKEKYENYIRLKKETEYYEMTDLEKRGKDRKFGQHIKRILKELKK